MDIWNDVPEWARVLIVFTIVCIIMPVTFFEIEANAPTSIMFIISFGLLFLLPRKTTQLYLRLWSSMIIASIAIAMILEAAQNNNSIVTALLWILAFLAIFALPPVTTVKVATKEDER